MKELHKAAWIFSSRAVSPFQRFPFFSFFLSFDFFFLFSLLRIRDRQRFREHFHFQLDPTKNQQQQPQHAIIERQSRGVAQFVIPF